VVYERDGGDLQSRGLYLDVPAWQASVFALSGGEGVATQHGERHVTS